MRVLMAVCYRDGSQRGVLVPKATARSYISSLRGYRVRR